MHVKNLPHNEEAKKRKLNVEELKSEADIFATKKNISLNTCPASPKCGGHTRPKGLLQAKI